MIGWDACTQDPHWIVRQIECHPGSAGWVQAFGAIIALAVAVGVPLYLSWRDRRDKKAERIKKSLSLVATLVPAVWVLENEVIRAGAALQTSLVAPPEQWDKWRSAARIAIPRQLVDAVPQMLDLEETIVGPFRGCATFALSYNGYAEQFLTVRSIFDDPIFGNILNDPSNWQALIKQMRDSLDLVRDAINEVRKLKTDANARAD